MGVGALPEFEVPLPEDDDALECPDKGTKMEWDSIRLAADRVQRVAIGRAQYLKVTQEQLRWVRLESLGGATAEQYMRALKQKREGRVPPPWASL